MNESTKPEERPTRDTYLAVIRLLVGLTCHELHSLRMYDIPSEQRRRRGVEPVFPSKEGDE